MDSLFGSGLVVAVGVALLLVGGVFLVQALDLTVPVTVRFVAPFHYRAFGGGASRDLNDEYFTLRNLYKETVDMTGWTVTDNQDHIFTFPHGFLLPTQATVTIHTGCGVDTPSELYWGSESPIWDNQGDTATLRDADGHVVDSHTYSRHCVVCGG